MGPISDTRYTLKNFNKEILELCYPKELEKYLGRKVWKCKFRDIQSDKAKMEGKTLLIEVNEGYSLGSYGLNNLAYAKLLASRWAELTETVDEHRFI